MNNLGPACMLAMIKALTKSGGYFEGFDFKKER